MESSQHRGQRVIPRAIGLAALLHAVPSTAQPRQEARLDYVRGAGTEDCPDHAAIREAVATRLGYSAFRDDAPRTISARISRSGSGLRADVELRDASGAVLGARQLTSNEDDCAEPPFSQEHAAAGVRIGAWTDSVTDRVRAANPR